MENYSNSFEVKTTADKAYKALTNQIPLWWTEIFEGSSGKTGEVFTIRFGDHVHKRMCVKELIPNSKVIWYVEDSLIAVPALKNQTEWMGTTIAWEIKEKEDMIQLQLTHIGLTPAVECYDLCTDGWRQYISSLKAFLETGTGNPHKK